MEEFPQIQSSQISTTGDGSGSDSELIIQKTFLLQISQQCENLKELVTSILNRKSPYLRRLEAPLKRPKSKPRKKRKSRTGSSSSNVPRVREINQSSLGQFSSNAEFLNEALLLNLLNKKPPLSSHPPSNFKISSETSIQCSLCGTFESDIWINSTCKRICSRCQLRLNV